ncbi:methionine aminotransferase [Namhaeicola litoreus]|uniref:Methionine aminotransferase n=1 Tax=Namhaeicola litoreus TaxID=1052145 RepID=A0ABW3XZN4_9FLAO
MRSKLPDIPTSIFAKMSQLAAEQNAINLSQGFPDFPSSPELINLVTKAMKEGYNQYAPMPGLIELREAISQKIELLHQYYYHPDSEITVTCGATQAIYTILSSFIFSGDEVIVFAPAYDSYAPTILAQGGIVREIALKAPDYSIPWEEVQAVKNNKTKMIIINSPHNPTGTILSLGDMKKLEGFVEGTNILILSDEVYEHIIFDNEIHHSVSRFPSLASRSFVVGSFGKTFHNTGWKMGYCASPERLMHEFRKIHQFVVFSVNHPIQKALAEFLKKESNYLSVPQFYQQKRDTFLSLIKDSRFTFTPSKGTYFQLLNYAELTDLNDEKYAEHLTVDHKIASIPISVFYKPKKDLKLLRFCFAKKNDTLEKAADILRKL